MYPYILVNKGMSSNYFTLIVDHIYQILSYGFEKLICSMMILSDFQLSDIMNKFIILLCLMFVIDGMCKLSEKHIPINEYDQYNPNWSHCINHWSFLLGSISPICQLRYHVIDELIVTIETNPEKSWQLYDLLMRCGVSTTISSKIMRHIELCLSVNKK